MAPRPAPRGQHPFKKWKSGSGLTYDEIAALVRHRGQEISGGYIRLIVNGHRTPRWCVAEALSQVTGGEVEPAVIMTGRRAKAA